MGGPALTNPLARSYANGPGYSLLHLTTMTYEDRLIKLTARAYEAYDHAEFWAGFRLLARFNRLNWHLAWNTPSRKTLSTHSREGHPLAHVNYRATPLQIADRPRRGLF